MHVCMYMVIPLCVCVCRQVFACTQVLVQRLKPEIQIFLDHSSTLLIIEAWSLTYTKSNITNMAGFIREFPQGSPVSLYLVWYRRFLPLSPGIYLRIETPNSVLTTEPSPQTMIFTCKLYLVPVIKCERLFGNIHHKLFIRL